MHDGYLFTLGVCGSATAGNPALILLDMLMAELPPVKRAAFLGEFVGPDKAGEVDDALLQAVVADLCDAELLILVTPVAPMSLPARLIGLLEYAAPLAATGTLREKAAFLVGITGSAEQPTAPFDHLQRFCTRAGMLLTTAVVIHEHVVLEPGTLDQLKRAAQQAYTQSRRRMPEL